MSDPLEQAATDALVTAAARMGVDPFRLARFLAHGRIADFLQALMRGESLNAEPPQTAALQSRFLHFLEAEARVRGAAESDRSATLD